MERSALYIAWFCMILPGLLPVPAEVARAGDWLTARGNAQRTGSLDDKAGPSSPKVSWVYRAPEQFLSSPVTDGRSLFIPSLAAFNTGSFHVLGMERNPAERRRWSKGAPFIKLPSVCSPALVDGLVIFGDGMHQTDGAVLYCLRAEDGLPIWRYAVEGKLVHMEGSPAVDKAKGRVYIGCGDAGVLCVDLRRVVLGGREVSLEEAQKTIAAAWGQLTAKYEEEKRRSGDLAIPPSEESLPKATPKLIWHKGKGQWHVDAPLALAGDKVLAGSAYIEEDKVGKRAVLCLNAADGAVAWESELALNPWGGATVIGDTVVVTCSSIRFEPKQIEGAKGAVVALGLADGAARWKKEVQGGVLSAAAGKGEMVVYAAMDGKVVGRKAADGTRVWTYDAATPFFAGPAIAGGFVYAADLKGVVHCMQLADGKSQWTFVVPSDPSVQTPGTIYGGLVVHGGNLYLATCNLDADVSEQPPAVICLSDIPGELAKPDPVVVDKATRSIAISCRVAPRKLPNLKEIYPIEVMATYPAPRGQKAHETVVTMLCRPSEVHKALLELGLKPGKPAKGENAVASGPEVRLMLELPGWIDPRQPRLVPIEKALVDRRTGKPLPHLRWHFTGSALRQIDPAKPDTVYGADVTGTLIGVFPVTDDTVIQSNLTMAEAGLLKLETHKLLLPEEGTVVKLIIQVK